MVKVVYHTFIYHTFIFMAISLISKFMKIRTLKKSSFQAFVTHAGLGPRGQGPRAGPNACVTNAWNELFFHVLILTMKPFNSESKSTEII